MAKERLFAPNGSSQSGDHCRAQTVEVTPERATAGTGWCGGADPFIFTDEVGEALHADGENDTENDD